MESSAITNEEQKLMSESKYRVYMSNIDKALKNFEYSSEWADLISALGKLNKAISGNSQYHIIPRRIKISKRLAQCMHPALPSGVHLKALETYDVIFSKTGSERLATELFIYSSGLFPLLGYAAMNVRPPLLEIYEKYFVPLGKKLQPALSGFLSGVLPGYESGLDHFDRTNSLLTKVCAAVEPVYFYTCMWECIVTNASIRLPAICYLLDHFNRRLSMQEQTAIMGRNHDILIVGLCACLNEPVILVQRNTLEFLLLGFPLHTNLISNSNIIILVSNALNTILRRDMSLNRRLYSWLLGTEVTNRSTLQSPLRTNSDSSISNQTYFESFSKDVLIQALKCTLKLSIKSTPIDLKPFRMLVSLLDKGEIGSAILDHVLCDVIRTMATSEGDVEVSKSANLLFATFDPAYIWNYMTSLYENSCKSAMKEPLRKVNTEICVVDCGPPNIFEVCHLTEYLLETLSLEMYNETTRIYLPGVFLAITQMLTVYSKYLLPEDITVSLKLCLKIISRIQPVITSPTKVITSQNNPGMTDTSIIETKTDDIQDSIGTNDNMSLNSCLEKSKSDSKLNQFGIDEEPIQRSTSNQNIVKRSPKKTKKSKSYSKLQELDKEICPDTGQIIPLTCSTPDLDNHIVSGSPKKQKTKRFSPNMKLKRFQRGRNSTDKKIAEDQNESSLESAKDDTSEKIDSDKQEISPIHLLGNAKTTCAEYSILEKCINLYKTFFQVYLSREILGVDAPISRISVNVVSVQQNDILKIHNIANYEVNDIAGIIYEKEYVKKVNLLFDTLLISESSRVTQLESLLTKSMTSDSSIEKLNESDISNIKNCAYEDHNEISIQKIMKMKLSETRRESIKLAANLLVEMSSFSTYGQDLRDDSSSLKIPGWLKILVLVACYCKADKELEVAAITTLFELISLLKSQIKHTANPGVTNVVMLPLLQFGHVNYLEFRTRTIQVITASLWDLLSDTENSVDKFKICSLLYQMHTCFDSGLVETVIGHRLSKADSDWSFNNNLLLPKFTDNNTVEFNEFPDRLFYYKSNRLADVKLMCTTPPTQPNAIYLNQVMMNEPVSESESQRFKKFELLWDCGRDGQSNQRSFEKTQLKIFDYLSLPCNVPIRIFVTKWLQESLLRGDLGRIIKPLLYILLAQDTKRVSVIIHANSINRSGFSCGSSMDVPDTIDVDDENRNKGNGSNSVIEERNVYAISSEDGNIKYHLEAARNKNKRSPIRSLQKKFFGVTIGTKNKTLNYISDKSYSPSESTPPISSISLIVNPLETSLDMDHIDGSDNCTFNSKIGTNTNNLNENRAVNITELQPNNFGNENPMEDTANIEKSAIVLPPDDYSSCDEDDSEESLSESESELVQDGSIDATGDVLFAMNNTGTSVLPEIKRYFGDCERVADVLSELDRTKNRKTYQVTSATARNVFSSSSNNRFIEKLDILADVNEGCVDLDLEESTPADEYFSVTSKWANRSIGDVSKNDTQTGSVIQEPNVPESSNCDNFDENNEMDNSISKTSYNSSNDSQSGICDNDDKIEQPYAKIRTASIQSTEDTSLDEINNKSYIKEMDKNNEKQNNMNKLMDKTIENSRKNVDILRKQLASESGYESLLRQHQVDRVHPLHTHMLLYCGVYDTKQVLYAFQTLRNIITCDCRTFLCLSMTTPISQNIIKQMLIRHRKSIFGKNFSGSIGSSEFSQVYRGCMYLDVIMTFCLYYSRSYFQKEAIGSNLLPSSEDINGNCKVQLASIELLTLICTDLITIIKDMGKGMAVYIGELMTKCKLQKTILHCVMSSVHACNSKIKLTFTEQVLAFNEINDDKLHAESIQIQLLRLLIAVIKLESEVRNITDDSLSKGNTTENPTTTLSNSPVQFSPNVPLLIKYLPHNSIGQQPMFLSAVLQALQFDNLRHLHRNWNELITSSLNCFTGGSLTNVVISVVHQLCANIDKISRIETSVKQNHKSHKFCADYIVSLLEAVTILCHFCLLDTVQQTIHSHGYIQTNPQTSSGLQSSNTGQLLNSIVHAIISSPQSSTNQPRASHILAARNAILSHLPVIVSSTARIWDHTIAQWRPLKQQLLDFLTPISYHHGVNFLAAISVTWQERSSTSLTVPSQVMNQNKQSNQDNILPSIPQACTDQLNLVKLVSNIKTMPMDAFVQTIHQVVRSPPNIYNRPLGLSIEVNALELFYFYMKGTPAAQFSDCWSSLLTLLRDGNNLSPPAQFVLLVILNEFVQRCPQIPFQDKKDLRDLHDVTSRLIDNLSNIAGACLEQTTWLRRNLAVKDLNDSNHSEILPTTGNQQYSVQSQGVLAAVLANLLDVAYGSQEKDKVIAILTTLMCNIVPYLKNHTIRNIPSFYACSSLMANICGYQYTRKAWRKEIFDLLLDQAFFQMDATCLPFWKQIMDSLMTYDNTTFRELMSRVSLTQTGGLNIFSSRELEYEQRSILLKRFAFVIFCSELDQYHKYMPEIQEQLANSLRLPSVVPSVQASVFLCFRVLLLRMSPDHVTSLWPTIIAEMVQVFLAIEQELKSDNDELSSHTRTLSGMDVSWVNNGSSNSISSNHLIHWRMVQLETTKLLELGCVLPASNLPHFQMYRWAFVGGQYDCISEVTNEQTVNVDTTDTNPGFTSGFVPHVKRIAQLMDIRFSSNSQIPDTTSPKYLSLACRSISGLRDLYPFFASLGSRWLSYNNYNSIGTTNCIAEIEEVLAHDFIETMPTSTLSTAR